MKKVFAFTTIFLIIISLLAFAPAIAQINIRPSVDPASQIDRQKFDKIAPKQRHLSTLSPQHKKNFLATKAPLSKFRGECLVVK